MPRCTMGPVVLAGSGNPELAAAIAQALGVARLVALDLHSAELGAGLRIPLDPLSAVPLLADELRQDGGFTRVVVSPDAGGVARAEAYARRLQLPVAVVEKTRISGSEVSARAVAGDVRGRSPILVDDIISTGATIEAALRALRTAGCPDA